MSHINHRRGETRWFVFQREHGKVTHNTICKGKRQSWKHCKKMFNRIWRARLKEALHADPEDPWPARARPSVSWVME